MRVCQTLVLTILNFHFFFPQVQKERFKSVVGQQISAKVDCFRRREEREKEEEKEGKKEQEQEQELIT